MLLIRFLLALFLKENPTSGSQRFQRILPYLFIISINIYIYLYLHEKETGDGTGNKAQGDGDLGHGQHIPVAHEHLASLLIYF